MFCHTAVDGDTMATLSSAVELARRVAAADVIGVQTDADAVSVQRMLAASGLAHDDLPEIHVEPVGIDTEAWLRQLDDPVVAALSSKLRLPGGVLAVGVDHLHYSAGVIHKLLAIETLLESGALGADDLRLVQIALPTSLAGPTHRFLQSQLEEIATRINGAHRRSDGLDVIDIVSSPPSPRELAALYRAADIALVTPVRDGFNRVAVEYSLANHDRPCVLILSDGTGTSHHLGWHCVTVDASDVLAIAAALRRVIADPDSPDRGSAERRPPSLAHSTAPPGSPVVSIAWPVQPGCVSHRPRASVPPRL
ncbi:MAG: trehalose-6-phosphate synthase [Acidimicrobiales bacterium]